MIAKSIHGYFQFGTCVRYLQDAQAGYKLGNGKDDGNILHNLTAFFRYLNNLNLQVTIRATSELSEFQKVQSRRQQTDRLSTDDASRLRDLIREIRKTLEAEIKGFEAYIVTPKRLDTRKLLQDVSSLLAPGVFGKIPELARFDLAEAGMCIAFERPTAAAFHLLRGTECVLRDFYCVLVKQNRSEQLWGPIVADLKKRKKAKQHSDLLDHLDHIRKAFRNPTQHPDKVYDIQEVQDLLGLCVDAINRMGKELPQPDQVPW